VLYEVHFNPLSTNPCRLWQNESPGQVNQNCSGPDRRVKQEIRGQKHATASHKRCFHTGIPEVAARKGHWCHAQPAMQRKQKTPPCSAALRALSRNKHTVTETDLCSQSLSSLYSCYVQRFL